MIKFLKALGKTWYEYVPPIYYFGVFIGYLICASKDRVVDSTELKYATSFALLAAAIILFYSLVTLIINALTDKYGN